jgi:hypothetical protein
MDVKYPDVEVQLSGEDGNVFSIIGRVSKAIRRKHGEPAAKEFREAATSCHSYDEVLQLCVKTVNVE